MKSPEEITHEFVEENLRDYLNKKPGLDLEWIKLIIHVSGINPEDLKNIFHDQKNVGDKKLYKKLFRICYKAKFKSEEIK